MIKADDKIDTIYLYRKQVFKDWDTVKSIRKRKYDLVVDMICGDSVTSLFLSQLVAPGATRVAVGKTAFAKYYHYHYPVNLSKGEHMIDITLRTLKCLGLNEDSFSYEAPMSLSDSAQSVANKFVANVANNKRWKSNNSKIIGLNISAGAPNRDWGEGNYVELLKLLSADIGYGRLVVFSVPWERHKAQRIISNSNADIELIPPGLGLEEVSALISKLDFLITPDTSLIHIARSFNVPVIGLYSNHTRNFNQWRAYGQTSGLIQGSAADDIHDISPKRVLAETVAMLERDSRKAI
ncbi:MAG: glycosyltransferase family 9 protein [candidate division Zixibacteria bacterium]|nr:glycosyltransferase family 9 protein [candidate division Zixibacteria bacterium]